MAGNSFSSLGPGKIDTHPPQERKSPQIFEHVQLWHTCIMNLIQDIFASQILLLLVGFTFTSPKLESSDPVVFFEFSDLSDFALFFDLWFLFDFDVFRFLNSETLGFDTFPALEASSDFEAFSDVNSFMFNSSRFSNSNSSNSSALLWRDMEREKETFFYKIAISSGFWFCIQIVILRQNWVYVNKMGFCQRNLALGPKWTKCSICNHYCVSRAWPPSHPLIWAIQYKQR